MIIFNQNTWLKSNTDMNTALRKKSKKSLLERLFQVDE